MKNFKIIVGIMIYTINSIGQTNNSSPWPSSGNVGIGTQNPNDKLEIVSDNAINGQFGITIKQLDQLNQSNWKGASGIQLFNLTTHPNISALNGRNWGIYSLGSSDPGGGGNLAIYDITASNSCRFLIKGGTGNIGIGTINPNNNKVSIDAPAINNAIECKVNSNTDKFFQCINKSNNIETFQVWGNGNTVIHCTQQNPTDHAFVMVDASGPGNSWVKNFIVRRNGTVLAREIFVNTQTWPDYVFRQDYKLMPIDDLEIYINQNHHLPKVPKASEIEENGLGLGNLTTIQMEKIEELTLYIIELKKQIDKQAEQIEELKSK